MFKALLKKQFLELNAFYFTNRKTGKRRSALGTAAFTALFVLIFASLGDVFFFVASEISIVTSVSGNDWLYFSMMGLFALLLGVFGSVFNTYSGLYMAKDNELLLSLPIPPTKILLVRLCGVYLMSVLYSEIVWIPTLINYFIYGNPTFVSAVNSVLLGLIIPLLVTVLTCIFGWLLAFMISRVPNKNLFTVIFSVVFIALYYFAYSKINRFLTSFGLYAEKTEKIIRSWMYPVYALGKGGAGDVISMAVFTLIVLLLAFLCLFIMSKTYVRVLTSGKTGKKTVYKEKERKANAVSKALFIRELKRYISSPVYLLNTGLGILFLPVLAVISVIKADALGTALLMASAMLERLYDLAPVIAVTVVCMILSINNISAPSVSLEGKTLWLIRSLPIETSEIIKAKERLHIVLNIIPAVITVTVFGIVLKETAETVILMALAVAVYVFFTADLGLTLNLLMPNLIWTNETAPVKQGMSVVICLFGGWVISLLISAVGYFAVAYLSVTAYLTAVIVVFLIAYRLLNRFLREKGKEIFESL